MLYPDWLDNICIGEYSETFVNPTVEQPVRVQEIMKRMDLEKFTAHIGMHVVSILALALARLQNGVTENLTFRGGLI
jgi:hypothetical protein